MAGTALTIWVWCTEDTASCNDSVTSRYQCCQSSNGEDKRDTHHREDVIKDQRKENDIEHALPLCAEHYGTYHCDICNASRLPPRSALLSKVSAIRYGTIKISTLGINSRLPSCQTWSVNMRPRIEWPNVYNFKGFIMTCSPADPFLYLSWYWYPDSRAAV